MKRTLAPDADSTRTKKSKDASDDEEPVLPTKAPATPSKTTAPKLASIFQPRTVSTASPAASSSTKPGLKWLDPIGPAKSCLHGIYGDPQPSAKVAFYDLDGTLVRPKNGKTFPSKTDEYDFAFLFPTPPPGTLSVINRIRQQHNEHGYAIVVITNQKQTAYSAKSGLATWKKKMAHIASALDVPLRVLASLADDVYRKPRLGMWTEFVAKCNGGVEVDRTESFFVGDAAGRKKYRDHQDTDLKWALNARLGFYTPEEYFLGKQKEYDIPTRPWSPSALAPTLSLQGLVDEPEDEMVTVDLATLETDPASLRILLPCSDSEEGQQPEIVLFVGAPASGKTYVYTRVFARADYVHVNQDTLRTRDKCLRVVADAVSAQKSCVVDNTNRDRATRGHYVALARTLGARIRCVYFDVPKPVCVHNNHFRAHHGPTHAAEPSRGILPYTAIESWFKDRQVPKRDEGFDAPVVRVKWGWCGDEQLREKYRMYYH